MAKYHGNHSLYDLSLWEPYENGKWIGWKSLSPPEHLKEQLVQLLRHLREGGSSLNFSRILEDGDQ
jgi:hypothetical protein